MNQHLREQAASQNLSLTNYLLLKIRRLKKETGIDSTIFPACPNSSAVIRASLHSTKRNNAPIRFAATLNQVIYLGKYRSGCSTFEALSQPSVQ